MTDALPKVGILFGDTNAAPTDAVTAAISVSMGDTNAAPIDALGKVSISGLGDMMAAQAESMSSVYKYRTAGAGSFVAPVSATYNIKLWGGGQGGQAGSTTTGGTGGTSGDLVSVSVFLNKGDTLPFTIAAASATAGTGNNSTCTPPGSGTTTYSVPTRTFTPNTSLAEAVKQSVRLPLSGTPSFVGAVSGTNTSTANLTVPAATQAGDIILFATATINGHNVTPSGYTLLANNTGSYTSGTSTITTAYALYYKVAVAGDAGSTVTYSSSATVAGGGEDVGAVAVYRGFGTPVLISAADIGPQATVVCDGASNAANFWEVQLPSGGFATATNGTFSVTGPTIRTQVAGSNPVGANQIIAIADEAAGSSVGGAITAKGGANAAASSLGGFTGTITPGNAGAAGALLAAGGKGGDAPQGGTGGAGATGAGVAGNQPGGGGGGGGGSLTSPGAGSTGAAGGIDIAVQLV